MIVLLMGIAYTGLIVARFQGHPLALPEFRYSEVDSDGTQGYDGQFASFAAREPAGDWRRSRY